ncbi:hypothetical protein HAP94_01735 [Acidithiobacillus ferrivorans]|nr:hypothetical protein [Acidithiobacillus ferrivorans]
MFTRKKTGASFPPPIFGPGILKNWQTSWNVMALKLQRRLGLDWNTQVFSAMLSISAMVLAVVTSWSLHHTSGITFDFFLIFSAPVLFFSTWTGLAWLLG